MMQSINLSVYVLPFATAAATLILLLVRSLTLRLLRSWARRTATSADDLLLASLRGPSIFWCVALSIHVGVAISDAPVRYTVHMTRAIDVLIILSVTLAAANLAGRLFTNYVRKSSLPLPSTGLIHGILKGTIFIIGFLITLASLGVSIAPLITTLGVGGLAVALALQDTLANLFAGMHILVEKSIRVGDYVKLETGEEGYVEDITWRTTRVRMLPNNTVVIPNGKLAKSTVVNYYLPEKRMALLIPVSVSYSANPREVARILVEEAERAIGKIPGLLAEPAPFVRFIPGFGESSLDFTLICQVSEFVDQYLAQHDLRMRIFDRFRQEGIEIPFPQRTVHIRQGQS